MEKIDSVAKLPAKDARDLPREFREGKFQPQHLQMYLTQLRWCVAVNEAAKAGRWAYYEDAAGMVRFCAGAGALPGRMA